jgi:quinol monooxygenase YgiN
MTKLAIIATIKTVPDKRAEYVKHLGAHRARCLANEPGTLQFEMLLPHEDPDTVMLYEVYSSKEAFDAHWNGESIQQIRRDAAGLQASLTGVRCDLIE